MKRKAYKRHRKRVQRCLCEWVPKTGLAWWHVTASWYDDEAEFRKTDGESVAAFRVWADWRYMTADLAVNVPAVARLDDDELERAVVHELCHALVNEMREGGIDHEERVVTTLASAFMWVRDVTRREGVVETLKAKE